MNMNKILLATCIGAVALLASCNTSKNTATTTADTTNGITGVKWQLIELRGNEVDEKINDRMPFISLTRRITATRPRQDVTGWAGSSC